MPRIRNVVVVSLLGACLMSGCATLKAATDSKVAGLINDLPLPKDLVEKIAYYQKYAAKFQKFHDSGELDETDVQDVLRDAGIISAGGTTKGKPAPKSPGVSQVPPPVQAYSGRYVWPTDAGVVSSEFGERWGKKHKGLDIAAEIGEPVKSTAGGVVIYSGSGLRGYGNALIVRHDSKVTSLYAHNSRLLVKSGQKVAGGQVIAHLGNTGRSTGPHLHFEIRNGDVPVSPRTRLGKSTHHAGVESLEETFAILD